MRIPIGVLLIVKLASGGAEETLRGHSNAASTSSCTPTADGTSAAAPLSRGGLDQA